MNRVVAFAVVALVVVVGLSVALGRAVFSSSGEPAAPGTQAPAEAGTSGADAAPAVGIAAVRQAAEAKKYLFAFFWKTENEQTAAMRKVFDEALRKVGDRAQSVLVRVSNPEEKEIVGKFGLDRAPMPLVLSIAPNGAVMGGFPQKFTVEDLAGAFGSPCTERCMKPLQDGKLVLLCVQNAGTKAGPEALRGVREFASDKRYADATEIVVLDPADAAEKPFLDDLRIDPKTAEAVTAFLVPPGSVIAEFKGATDKEELIAALQKANTGCGPGGCGPGGCGPKK